MVKLHWDSAFIKCLKKKESRSPGFGARFEKATTLLTQNPFDHKLRTHKLTGKLNQLWAFSCGYDCRVIFEFLDDHNILLIDIGSHDEVY